MDQGQSGSWLRGQGQHFNRRTIDRNVPILLATSLILRSISEREIDFACIGISHPASRWVVFIGTLTSAVESSFRKFDRGTRLGTSMVIIFVDSNGLNFAVAMGKRAITYICPYPRTIQVNFPEWLWKASTTSGKKFAYVGACNTYVGGRLRWVQVALGALGAFLRSNHGCGDGPN
jgi:hypothetical protein